MTTTAKPPYPPTTGAPGQDPGRRLLGEVVETRAQATTAAKNSNQILAILENGEAADPTDLLERLVTGLAEQRQLLERMDGRLTRIEARLGLSG